MSAYGGYIERLSRRVSSRLSDIEAIYNFDLGPEFEVAMCHLLTELLPARYGVCRGFVVTENNATAGDDLIIFDKISCPTLRALPGFQYAVKEQIPVEAVYAYIECKNTIDTESLLEKAIEQVRSVKGIMLTRQLIDNPLYEAAGPSYNGKIRDWPRQTTRYKNQPFGMIVARNSKIDLPAHIAHDAKTPDLLILGDSQVASQSVVLGPDGIKGALFYDDKHWATLRIDNVQGVAFGLGIVSLLQALGQIELPKIDWRNTLNAHYWDGLQ